MNIEQVLDEIRQHNRTRHDVLLGVAFVGDVDGPASVRELVRPETPCPHCGERKPVRLIAMPTAWAARFHDAHRLRGVTARFAVAWPERAN